MELKRKRCKICGAPAMWEASEELVEVQVRSFSSSPDSTSVVISSKHHPIEQKAICRRCWIAAMPVGRGGTPMPPLGNEPDRVAGKVRKSPNHKRMWRKLNGNDY